MSALTKVQITAMALNNGFKLKVQQDGALGLNPYVFEFARALLAVQSAELEQANFDCAKWMQQHSMAEARIAALAKTNGEQEPVAWFVHKEKAGTPTQYGFAPKALYQDLPMAEGHMYEQIDFAGFRDAWIQSLYASPQPASADDARDAARWRFSAASCVTGSPEESIMSEIGNEWPDEDDTIRTSGEFTRFIDACMVALKDRK